MGTALKDFAVDSEKTGTAGGPSSSGKAREGVGELLTKQFALAEILLETAGLSGFFSDEEMQERLKEKGVELTGKMILVGGKLFFEFKKLPGSPLFCLSIMEKMVKDPLEELRKICRRIYFPCLRLGVSVYTLVACVYGPPAANFSLLSEILREMGRGIGNSADLFMFPLAKPFLFFRSCCDQYLRRVVLQELEKGIPKEIPEKQTSPTLRDAFRESPLFSYFNGREKHVFTIAPVNSPMIVRNIREKLEARKDFQRISSSLFSFLTRRCIKLGVSYPVMIKAILEV